MRNWRVPITFTLSLDGVVTSWSEGVRAVLGYDASEFIGQRFELIFTDEDVLSGVPERLLSTALEAGSAALAGWRLDKDGERRFTRGELTSLYGADDEIVGLSVVFLPFGTGPLSMRRAGSTGLVGPDVTAAPSVSGAAGERPGPELLSDLISGLDERFYVLDDELRIVFVNKFVEEAWGKTYEELVGQSFIELFPHLQDTAFLSEHIRVANEGVSARFETTSTLTNKRVEVSIYPNVRGGVSVLIRDPFERSEPDQGILSNERLAEAYAALEIALIEWEPEQGTWEESQTTPDIFGLQPKSTLGSRQAQLDLIMPADVDRYVQNVTAAIAAGTTWSHQYRIVRPGDGEVAWLEEFGSPIRQSEPPRYSVLAWDITSTKLVEERMRSSQRRLQQELAADRRLREIMSRPMSAGGPEVALAEVLSGAVELFAVHQATMRLYFKDEGLLKIVAQHRFGKEYLSENETVEIDLESIDERLGLGAGSGGSSVSSGVGNIGHDVMADGGYRERWVPLTGSGGHVIGAMALHWRRPWKFSGRDEHDLLLLTRQAAALAEAYLSERRAHELMEAQRARAEAHGAELLESEVRFRRAFEVGPVAACITTVEEDRFLEINSGYLRVTGYDPAEVIGRTSRELGQWSSPADQAKLEAAFEAGSMFHELELKLRTKEGDIRDVLLSGQQITYDGQRCWLKMFNDVTEQHRSQEELMTAIHEVMSDTSWLGKSVVQRLAEMRGGGGVADDGEADLTARERQILELVAAGHDDKGIATQLGISQKTVRNHLANTYSKVSVHSRSEAIVWARDRGLVARG